jgi:hypothetical protein
MVLRTRTVSSNNNKIHIGDNDSTEVARVTRQPTNNTLDRHQVQALRYSAATHLGEQKASPGLLMAETRHRNPRTAMRYIPPSADAVAEVTELLDTAPQRFG